MLLLGAVGAVVALRRPTLLRLFLIWDFLLSLAVYCWANERFSWLVLHPLLPLMLLAGLGVQSIWDAPRALDRAARARRRRGLRGLRATTSWRANVVYDADPREFLVSTQSSPEVRGVRDEVTALADRAEREGRSCSIVVDSAEGATFPWAWYFRDLPAGYLDMSTVDELPPDTDVAILTEANRDRLLGTLAGYDGRRFPFRIWWVRDYGEMSAARLVGLVHGARAVEPHGRHAGVALRAPGRVSVADASGVARRGASGCGAQFGLFAWLWPREQRALTGSTNGGEE